jgi:hypothetical protein
VTSFRRNAIQIPSRSDPTHAMRLRAVLPATFVILFAGCSALGGASPETTQALIDLGQGLNDLQQQLGALQEQSDSLRAVVAKQDALVRQLANLAGLPIPQ